MGGFGSGRRSDLPTTDDCIRIGLAGLKSLGMLKRDCFNRRTLVWSSNGTTTAELTVITDICCREAFPCLKISGVALGRSSDCLIQLDSASMRFGGERWYALCPNTGRRCTSLVLPPGKTRFASVKGWGVPYASQRECEVDRAYRAIDKASSRQRALSKYARKPTRERLAAKIDAKTDFVEGELERLASMIL
jgi:hypothetical protein